ncbi:MAG: hypothetical protein JJ908_08670 [Rhizobiales bacterium]|nr:hypothetical protein [Hyphomicrobiales bacterium]MBO6697316.1 hypothetical protein [Hyphomicrobiales bacterium]MBO6736429.1 hypothetical protein [Hyphomicrobiales bacterium]MBO6912899.1 hypothetical protein [Hyphomicrobiales bacterium]MBO6954067.1 hypothetical protein [Hyphomicrobiales bacterium]
MSINKSKRAASLIADSGGKVIGRTRIQKIAYLLTVAGMENDFKFSYKHYGPYSEELADALMVGNLLGEFSETEHPANWGGTYSVFESPKSASNVTTGPRSEFAKAIVGENAIELELAATAVFLAKDGFHDPWGETARRKPEKSSVAHIDGAKKILERLRAIDTPEQIPVF